MNTKEKKTQVNEVYNKFINYTKHAEQHEYPRLMFIDLKISHAYNDLMENWSDEHADIFINAVNNVLEQL